MFWRFDIEIVDLYRVSKFVLRILVFFMECRSGVLINICDMGYNFEL